MPEVDRTMLQKMAATRGPLDLPAIAAWNARQRIARAEYEARPIVSCAADWIDEDGERIHCDGIAGKHGICKAHVAAFRAQGVRS